MLINGDILIETNNSIINFEIKGKLLILNNGFYGQQSIYGKAFGNLLIIES
jgi:hypothetical protein